MGLVALVDQDHLVVLVCSSSGSSNLSNSTYHIAILHILYGNSTYYLPIESTELYDIAVFHPRSVILRMEAKLLHSPIWQTNKYPSGRFSVY